MVVVGDILGAPETGGWMDGVQNVEASSNARTATSIASREGGDGRLETGRAEVSFGWRWRRRITAEEIRRRGQEGAHGQEDERGTEGGRRGHLVVMEWSSHGGRTVGLR
jgi:hypothetical protein